MLHRHPRSLFALPCIVLFACAEFEQPLGDVPTAGNGGSGGTAGSSGGNGGAATAGTGGSSSGMGGSGNAPSTGGAGNAPSTGGAGNAPSTGGSGNAPSTGGAGNAPSTGGSGNAPSTGGAGNAPSTGGSGNAPSTGGSGNAPNTGGTAGTPPIDPYAPRTGSFKVLAYFNTQGGFTHTQAINTGRTMLMAMATKQGFEVTFSDSPADLGAANLEQYELLFGLNPTGTSLESRAAERAAVEEWMTTKNGAFAGVHSSTDFMPNWAFWKEVTGQYYDSHDTCCSQQNIQWEASASTFVAVAGLPSPWQRSEEWYKFKSWDQWSAKPGFRILSKVTTNTDGGTRPVSYIREWGNFRSFYTSLGHEGPTYNDANFIKHVAAGVMWAVRREALLVP